MPEISVSQVSRDNNSQDYAMFADVFYYLVDKALENKKLAISLEEFDEKVFQILFATCGDYCL